MAASRIVRVFCALNILFFFVKCVQSGSVLFEDVPNLVFENAVNLLKDSSTSDQYKPGELINAQKWANPPYFIHRLIFKFDPVCKDSTVHNETCLAKACILDIRQHEQGDVDVLPHTVQCLNILDHWSSVDIKQRLESIQEKEIIQNIEKEIKRTTESSIFDADDGDFVAVQGSSSSYCPGCPYDLNLNVPGLISLTEQALQSMDESGISDFKHKLINAIKVTRTVPHGSDYIQYQILMEIGESNCLNSMAIERKECSLQHNLPIKLCLVTFTDQYSSITNTYVKQLRNNNCTDFQNYNEMHSAINTYPEEGESYSSTEFFDQVAQEVHQVFNITPDANSYQTVIKPESIYEQPEIHLIPKETVDNKSILKLRDSLQEFDKYLQDFDLLSKTSEPNNYEIPITEKVIQNVKVSRRKRALASSEGRKSLITKLAENATSILDKQDNDNKRLRLIDVISWSKERQKNGLMYFMTVEVAPTDCSEKDVKSTECLDEIPGPSKICKFSINIVNEKKPLEKNKLLNYSCKTKRKSKFFRNKRGTLLGARKSINPEDPIVKEIISKGVKKISTSYEGPYEPIVAKVKTATSQVVAGVLYEITFDIGSSTCEKGKVDNCQLNADKELNECVIKAWSRPWLENENLEINFTCMDRKKRSLKGVNYSQKMLNQAHISKEEKLFNQFKTSFGKYYGSDKERDERFTIFKKNLDIIEELQRNEQGTGRYGVTQFADLTKEEFTQRYLGLKQPEHYENFIPLPKAEIPKIDLPEEFDWRHYNVVTPVKNQGSCGSCWAFSVTGNVEGQYALKHGKLLSFSEQELVDCDKLDEGCNGGLPDTAYRAIEELGGLETEEDYPYDARRETCQLNKNKVKVSIASGLNITSNETEIAQWLVKNGPVSIGINANAMQFYMGGVSHPFKFLCSPNSLDHGVLIVGYGIKNYPIFKKRMPYWIIKNSWGPRWGEKGYYRVYRGDGTCGLNQMVTTAIIN